MKFILDDFKNVSEIESSFQTKEEENYLRLLLAQARKFLNKQKWCKSILSEYCGLACDDAFGAFLFEVEPAFVEVDNFLWVIAGDLPPAYITCEEAKNAIAALNIYLGEMDRWVDAVLSGKSTDNLIPVDAKPTKENALILKSRLDWIGDNVVKPNMEYLPQKKI